VTRLAQPSFRRIGWPAFRRSSWQLFAAPDGLTAKKYLRLRRRRLLSAACQWTNEKRFPVNKLLARLIDRCDQLDLYVRRDDPQQDFRVASFITTLVMNHLSTGKFKRSK
jgi:hypothetical protein